MNSELIKIFPVRLRELLRIVPEEGLTELRFRAACPVMLLYGAKELFLSRTACRGVTKSREESYCVSANEIKEMMEHISNYSFYAYEEEIRQGYLTIQGGHRIGLCGRVVMGNDGIRTIRNISFLNIRLAGEKKGCAEKVLPKLMQGTRFCHTLIVSPPGGGKTTLLRDLVRLLSDGFGEIAGRKVGIVDERSEIAACFHGIPQNEVGIRTDVLDGCPKAQGIPILLRAMSPEVIAIDEIGTREEALLMTRAVHNGCSILATAHGGGYQEWKQSNAVVGLFTESVFERYVFLQGGSRPGQIELVCDETFREVTV